MHAVSLLFLSLVPCLSAFGNYPTRHCLLSSAFREREDFLTLRMAGDFPEQEEIYKGTVDWDEEWKKVVRGKDQPKERPSGNPKSDLEKVAVKAQREAEATIFKVKTQAKKAVNFRSLQSDWKVRASFRLPTASLFRVA
jgi:hypothetical protein